MKDIAVADWTSPLSGYGPSPDGSVILLLRKKNAVKDTADSGKKLLRDIFILLTFDFRLSTDVALRYKKRRYWW